MADGKVIIGTKIDESGLNQGVKNVESTLKNLKGTIAKLGIGTAVLAGMKKAVDGFTQFQTGIAKASSLFGDVEVDMEHLEKRMMALSTASGITAESLNEGLYQALSAGIPVTEDMAEATQFLEQATKLSVAGFTDLPTAIDATAKTLNAYGYGVEKAEHIQDILIQTQNRGITTVGELGAALSNVTPIAASFGVSFEDVGASLALLTAQGVPTAQATTQLRQAIAELGKDGTQAAKALKEAAQVEGWSETTFQEMMDSGKSLADVLGIMGESAEKSGKSILDMFSSVEAGQAALSIGSNLEKYNANLKAMEESAGSVEGAYNKMDATVGRSLERIGTAFTNILTSMAQSSNGVISDIVGFVEEATTGIANAFGENGLEGAITYMIDNLDTQIPRIFNWGLEMMENLANSMLKAIPVVAQTLFTAFGNLLQTVLDHREEIFNLGIDMISNLWEGISSAFSSFAEALGQIFSVIKEIWNHIDWKSLGVDMLNYIWEGIKGAFSWFGEKLEQLGKWFIDKIQFWKKGEEEGEEFMDDFYEGAESSAIDSVDGLISAIDFGFSKVVENAKKSGTDTAEAFTEALEAPEFEKAIEEDITDPLIDAVLFGTLAVEEIKKPVFLTLSEIGDAIDQLSDKEKEAYQSTIGGFDLLGKSASEFFESLASGENFWKAFARTGLEAIASLVDALGHQLAANAALAAISKDPEVKAGFGKALAGSIAAYSAAGLIRGWAGRFATGGIVQGAYTGGDNLTASVKAGEVILNHAQAINTARLLDALEKSTDRSGGMVIAFNGPVYGDKEEIATMVYDKVRSLQSEGRLAAW